MRIITPTNSGTIYIGHAGENNTTQIQFDVTEWEELGEGTYTLIHQRSQDTAGYTVSVTHEDHKVKWTVGSGDLVYQGYGKAQLVLTINGAIAKSAVYVTYCSEALSNTADPPDPWQSWVDEVIEAKEDAEDARDEAEAAAEDILDLTATATVASTTGTPSVTVTVTEGTEAKNMAFAFSGIKGETGAKGDKGDKGDTGNSTVYTNGEAQASVNLELKVIDGVYNIIYEE